MTAPYKKRALAGWNHDKRQSNRDERQVEELDIEDQTAETSNVSKKVNKKKSNTREKKILRILSSCRWAIKMAGGDINAIRAKARDESRGDWSRQMYMRFYNENRSLHLKFDLWLADEGLSTKVKRQILEVKDKLGVET